ncbi:MlaE family lipid ABC transporter permease subunit [Nitrospirillum sp. BR 11164]|uniref:MlaE family lipid ABC transporter permease subunit n=1 Tax=Nitrospirillum sp. BR 11164 TaxID=3104324 RepID=UPI002AFF46EA|nr:MlaE family lipid ABC transporter permease subunit [Nitrospirillum sp. BR 11164]MEA1650582.1 MlaE family lipid ABC transporter permease subunit [Nitrospirillum sp. BR 11164]
MAAAGSGVIKTAWDGDHWLLAALGRWDLAGAEHLDMALTRLKPERKPGQVLLDLSGLSGMDTAGALVLDRLIERLRAEGETVAVVGATPAQCTLLRDVRRAVVRHPEVTTPHRPFHDLLERVGKGAFSLAEDAFQLLSFFGLVFITIARVARDPRRFRWTAFFFHLEQVGLNALPIIGLLTFLIGVVLAYQSADQLRRFGAEIFVVNLLGIGILRELGVLITSIIVAGRSGSAFTAQIGTMKVNQEVDAMQVLGLDPIEMLVLPRLAALFVALPLVSFYADVVGLFGGAVMSYGTLDITLGQFLRQLQVAVSPTTMLVGLIKAPVFAMVISLVGCFEGLNVTGSAESVGKLTTRSVVESIFLVIVLDALFSILFSYLKI